jgi:hypothetical protein
MESRALYAKYKLFAGVDTSERTINYFHVCVPILRTCHRDVYIRMPFFMSLFIDMQAGSIVLQAHTDKTIILSRW